MIIAIVVAVLAIVAIVLILAATKPDAFRIERATNIRAQPDKIFPFINDFHQWHTWSPFEKLDPAMKKTFLGAAKGRGAIYEWEGNGKAGKGRMEIMESSSPNKIIIKLDFLKPFEGHNITEFTLRPQDDATEVTWTMRGPIPFATKIFHVFIDMDKMIGKDFDAGLAKLKAVAES